MGGRFSKAFLKRQILNYLSITAGAFCFGASVSLFMDPNNLAPGGVGGLAVIVNRLTNIPTGTLIFLINLPILGAGLWKFGLRFLVSTIYATIMCSTFTNLLVPFAPLTENIFLASLGGGIMMAVGLALVFRAGATTGGSDIIVKFLRLKYKHLKSGKLFLITDMIVVSASLFVFDDVDTILFAMISVLIYSTVFDMLLYGGDEAKMIYIISDCSEQITRRLLKELDVGVTYLKGKGAYSNVEKDVILCVLRNTLAPKAEEIVKTEDPLAFMIVTRATEIYGEGYKNILGERL